MTKVRKIVFATNNQNKIREIKEIIGDKIEIVSLKDIGCDEDLPETTDTIAGNALMKARYVSEKYGYDCFADDTGLEVKALGGAPGVHTARYAPGTSHDSDANVSYLLENMKNMDDRRARFITVIALIENGKEKLFEGVCPGTISRERMGTNGFGYDPVFVPEGCELSFARMSADDKNEISHRGRAVRQLVEYLK